MSIHGNVEVTVPGARRLSGEGELNAGAEPSYDYQGRGSEIKSKRVIHDHAALYFQDFYYATLARDLPGMKEVQQDGRGSTILKGIRKSSMIIG